MSPLTRARNRAGEILARASSSAQDVLSTTPIDLTNMTITFTVPPDRDVSVQARVPGLVSPTASATITVTLTDENNVVKDTNWARSGTASRNGVTVPLEEIIPAGSGTVTRKLRAVSTADGSVNNSALATVRLKAVVE